MKASGINIRTLSLAGAFLLFNVGLPIVIDTCPMPRKTGSMACPLCSDDGREGHGTVLKGKPCCEPQIAAERNLNEFIGTSKAHPAIFIQVAAVIPPAVTMSGLPVAGFSVDPSPPPHTSRDIPVLLSTLLI